MDEEIRIQYSGFIIFLAQILSVVTGLVFTLLLTRNMSESQFGIWTNIFDYTGYFTILSSLFPFWVTRFVARGKEGTIKTSLLINAVLAAVSIGIYLSLISSITTAIHTEAYLIVYLVAALQILNLYLITNLESCLRGVKPQVVGYGLLLEEIVKVTLALVLIVGFHQVFLGAMVALTVSALIQALYYIKVLSPYLRQRVQWNYVKEWLKGSLVFIYNGIGNQLIAFVFVFLFLYGGQEARADYQAAAIFATIVGYSSSIAFAMYPSLLVDKCSDEQVSSSFKTVLMFAIPLAAITIVMSKSFLNVLSVVYDEASPVLILLTFDMIVVLISQFYASLLLGAEELDVEGKIPLGKLVKSKIFKVYTMTYVQAAISLPLTYFLLTQTQIGNPLEAVLYVTAINLGVHVITASLLYALTHGQVRIIIAWRSLGKYLAVSAVTAVVLILLPNPTTIGWTFGKVFLGISMYAALLMAIDSEARVLVRAIIQEIRSSAENIFRRAH